MSIRNFIIAGTLAFMLGGAATATPTQHRDDAMVEHHDAGVIVPEEIVIIEIVEQPQPGETAANPDYVGTIAPFTEDGNYMSQPGFYRYAVYSSVGVWMDRDEAVATLEY